MIIFISSKYIIKNIASKYIIKNIVGKKSRFFRVVNSFAYSVVDYNY